MVDFKKLKDYLSEVPPYVYGISCILVLTFSLSSIYLLETLKIFSTNEKKELLVGVFISLLFIEIVMYSILRLPFFRKARVHFLFIVGGILGFSLVFQGFIVYLLISMTISN